MLENHKYVHMYFYCEEYKNQIRNQMFLEVDL